MDLNVELSLNVCRICAQPTNQTDCLYEMLHNGIILVEMLEYCLKRQISRQIELPQRICANCKTNLINTYNFHILCESSEQIFVTKFHSSDANQESNNTKTIRQSDSTNQIQINDVNLDHMKNEIDDCQQSINIETDDFGYKTETTHASELVCVEENFDDDSLITDENHIEFPLSKRLRNRNVSKSPKQRKNRYNLDEKVFECFDCKEKFDRLQQLRTHIQTHDDNQKPFECKTCNMKFMNLNSWFRHRSRHTKNIHDCEYCNQSFNTLTILKQHIRELHADRLNAYKCDQCSDEFSIHFLFIWHKECHKKTKQLKCSTCHDVFFNERKLKAHIRDNHASK